VKAIVIVNPISGRGRAGKLTPTMERILSVSGLDFKLLQSEQPWHTTELAKAAARQGVDAVIAVGGERSSYRNSSETFRSHWSLLKV
jgi:diacylglycerol kinase (ATP)